MILFIIALSLVIGLNIRYSLLLCIPLAIFLVCFLLYRFKNKLISLLSLGFIGLGIGLSFISLNNDVNNRSALIIESKTNYVVALSNFEKVYIYDKNTTYEIGDIVTLHGYKKELNFNTIESQFDFKYYLNKKGVNYQFEPTKIDNVFSFPLRLKAYKNNVFSGLNENAQLLLKSIMFSESGDGEITDTLSSLHLTRLLSTSGVYLYGFYAVFVFILQLFCKKSRSELIGIFCLLPYVILSFPKFSSIRLFSLLIFRYINKYKLHNKYSFFTILSINALFFLIIDYHLAYTTGFILGYLIPIIFYFINVSISRFKLFKRKILAFILFMLYFIPFEISFYNEVNVFSYILQPILSPIFVFYGIVSSLALFYIPVAPIINGLTNLLSNLILNLKFLSIGIYVQELNSIILIFYNVLFFALLHYININFKPLKNLSIFLISSLLCLLFLPVQNIFYNTVTFINVGQGDACLIQNKFTTILIDTGGSLYNDIANDCLIPYLKKHQIYNIDLLITTHDDFDHSGAKNDLINNFSVKRYINNQSNFPLSINGIDLINYNYFSDTSSDDNDKSLVIGFNINGTNYLVTGDAPIEIEKKIMDYYAYIPCDVLKVGHHGSETSTSDDFLTYLSPKEAVISVGRNNYGHPSNVVLNRLKKHKINIRRTDKEGSICYKTFFI